MPAWLYVLLLVAAFAVVIVGPAVCAWLEERGRARDRAAWEAWQRRGGRNYW